MSVCLFSSLHDCGITDVSSLTQSLTNTKALQFLKELHLSNNTIGKSKEQLTEVLQGSNCKLSLEKGTWFNVKAGLKFAGSAIGGYFTTESKTPEPEKSTGLDELSSGKKNDAGRQQSKMVVRNPDDDGEKAAGEDAQELAGIEPKVEQWKEKGPVKKEIGQTHRSLGVQYEP
ncbi:hypothetical protein cypCar_00031764 [Cyprinus carpio]|nr:hypothetical protein cypCar_00031764 [Cyprinus carpio]